MIDFLKQRKIIIIIGILVIIFIGWRFYNSSNDTNIENNDFIVNDTKEEKKSDNEEEEMMAVHVTGEVKNPGVVKIKEGSRIEDIIKAAGGLTENADITNVNLAYVVEDGMKIRIPSSNEENDSEDYITEDSGKGVILSEESNNSSSSIVNINTANEAELEQLPGIGPSISSKIVEYRNKNGKFKNVEDIKNVTGIGDSKFEKIKEYIKVK